MSSQSYAQNTFLTLFGAHRGACICIYVHKCTCFLEPINRTLCGPNGYSAGTFWPNPSILGSLRRLKNSLVKSLITTVFEHFLIQRGFESPRLALGPNPAQMSPRNPKTGQNRGLGITLARQKIFTSHIYTFSRFLGVPDRSRGSEGATERSGPQLRGRPAGGSDVGSENFFAKKFLTKINIRGAPKVFWAVKN